MSKSTYRVGNWKEYNKSLINRGNLTLWFSDDMQTSWYAKPSKTRTAGRPLRYSHRCIEVALTLRSLFRFPLRATQGFLEGLVTMLKLDLKVPHYSRLSRRAAGLEVQFYSKKSSKNPTDIVVDSTGLKIYGEGEWKMRTHGKQKRRTWRKLHIAINPDGFEVIALELTPANIHDDSVMPKLLQNQTITGKVYADGAYISKTCFDSLAATGGEASIALRSGTGTVKKDPSPGQVLRNKLVLEIRDAGGKVAWKKSSGYHKRSLVETEMFRFKTILGGGLSSRLPANQVAEAQIKVLILNRMSCIGMPKSHPAT
ncbi:IS5 family transposase [Bdellovibrionota bacterium FG-2]